MHAIKKLNGFQRVQRRGGRARQQAEGTLAGPPIERVTQEPERSESVPAWTRFQQ